MKITSSAPIDFAFICTEHMPVDRTELSLLCQMYTGWGISPVVRIPSVCSQQAAMALDAGAQGIVVPYVETAEDAELLASTVYYRPIKGKLLRQFASGEREPTEKTKAFLKRFNRHNYTIIGIESVPAYENLDQIISQRGVDGVFIGYHDLSVSLEVPEEWDSPDCWRVIEDIVVRCRAASVGVGLHLHPRFHAIERVQRLVELGMNWVLDGADAVFTVDELERRRKHLIGASSHNDTTKQPEPISSCIAT